MSTGFMAGLPNKYPPISAAFLIFPNRSWVRYWKPLEQDGALYQTLLSCRGWEACASTSSRMGCAWELHDGDVLPTLSSLSAITCWSHCRDSLQKGSQPITLMPVEAKFSSYFSFIDHSTFYSKIMGAVILLLLNICQASWLTTKNPFVSHWPPTKASFLTHLWITVGTETPNLFLCTQEAQDLKAGISFVQ